MKEFAARLQGLLERGVRDGVFPGAAAFALRRGEPAVRVCAGHRMVVPERREMDLEVVFDLASLTKPLATAPVALMLAEEGAFDLDAPVGRYLPEFAGRAAAGRDLLTHRSGLPAWKPLYIDPGERGRALEHLGGLEPGEVGGRIVYSCLGYIVLERLTARLTGRSLAEEAQARIFGPLGMRRTRFNPPAEWAERCAATEDSSRVERRMSGNIPRGWRKGVVCGEVHDENAYFLGGVSGNAGLFAPLGDLERYARCLLDGGAPVFSERVFRQLSEPFADDGETVRSHGWIALPDGRRTHTGFTGTAMQWDPDRGMASALLTNRVHPDASKEGIAAFRREFFEAAFA